MDTAREDRMILESRFAVEMARQFEAAADAAQSGALPDWRRRPRRRLPLVFAAALAVACVVAVVGSAFLFRSGDGDSTSLSPTGASGRQEQAPLVGSAMPRFYGDELVEMTPGADGRIWAWGVTHGIDKGHPGGPLLEVWDGQSWSRLTVPGNEIYGVAEPAVGDLWVAVGTHRGGRLAHWDGARWRLYPAMGFGGTSEASSVLLAFSSDDVWAVGEASLDPRVSPTAQNLKKPWLHGHLSALHWDGTRWRSVAMPSLGRGAGEACLRLLRGSSPDSIWALGDYTQYRRKLVAGKRKWVETAEGGEVLLHWDGRRWSIQPGPAGQLATNRRDAFHIEDMAAAADGALWCAGSRWFGPDNTGDLFVPVVLRLQGSRWHVMASSASAAPPGDWRNVMLSSISLTGEDDVWLSGRSASGADGSVLWRWDGSSWATTTLDISQLPGQAALSRVLALAPDDVWALCNGSTTEEGLQGAQPSFLPNAKEEVERQQPSFLRFDGSTWQPIMSSQSTAGP